MSALSVVAEPLESVVTVSAAEPARAASLADAIGRALREEMAVHTNQPPRRRVLRLMTRRRVQELGPSKLADAIVIVRVTATNARRLGEIVASVRSADAAGVQLVWDGVTPDRGLVERRLFEVLEQVRATPAGPPVILARYTEPALALRLLVEQRSRKHRTISGRSET